MEKHIIYKNIYDILKELELIILNEKLINNYESNIYEKNYLKTINFMKKYYNQIVELQERGYIQIRSENEGFYFQVPFLFEKNNNFFPIITSKGQNFLKNYKNLFRRVEYDYYDNKFFGSLSLGFIGGVISFLLTEILKFIITKI